MEVFSWERCLFSCGFLFFGCMGDMDSTSKVSRGKDSAIFIGKMLGETTRVAQWTKLGLPLRVDQKGHGTRFGDFSRTMMQQVGSQGLPMLWSRRPHLWSRLRCHDLRATWRASSRSVRNRILGQVWTGVKLQLPYAKCRLDGDYQQGISWWVVFDIC